jgi:hypothetical protein
MLTVELLMRSSDGTTAPYTCLTGKTLTAAATIDEWFTLGPATVNAVDVGDVMRWSLDFGVEVKPVQGDGKLYPTDYYIGAVRPKITIETLSVAKHSTWGIGGASYVVVLNLLKGANAGRAGSGDKTITTSGARVTVEELGVAHDGEAMLRISAVAYSASGTAHPIAIT